MANMVFPKFRQSSMDRQGLAIDEWFVAGGYYDNCDSSVLRGFLMAPEKELARINERLTVAWTEAQFTRLVRAVLKAREEDGGT
jgi:hypothetical protein